MSIDNDNKENGFMDINEILELLTGGQVEKQEKGEHHFCTESMGSVTECFSYREKIQKDVSSNVEVALEGFEEMDVEIDIEVLRSFSNGLQELGARRHDLLMRSGLGDLIGKIRGKSEGSIEQQAKFNIFATNFKRWMDSCLYNGEAIKQLEQRAKEIMETYKEKTNE